MNLNKYNIFYNSDRLDYQRSQELLEPCFLVIPNVLGICTWSPPLDQMGNSCRGVQFCQVCDVVCNLLVLPSCTDHKVILVGKIPPPPPPRKRNWWMMVTTPPFIWPLLDDGTPLIFWVDGIRPSKVEE